MDNLLRDLNNKARDFIKKLNIDDQDKIAVEDIVYALINQDEDKLQDALFPVEADRRAEYIQLANAVIDDLRIDVENEIIENGSLDELENLRQLTEAQDEATAAALDKLMEDADKASLVAAVVPQAQVAGK